MPAKLETALYPPFATVLQNDVQGEIDFTGMLRSVVLMNSEFVPYVFQLFAALLEANPSGSLSEYYTSLLPPILNPAPWASKGNVPALVRLLSAIISRGVTEITQNNQLETVLGVFQSLVATKTNETFGFELLECIVDKFPP